MDWVVWRVVEGEVAAVGVEEGEAQEREGEDLAAVGLQSCKEDMQCETAPRALTGVGSE